MRPEAQSYLYRLQPLDCGKRLKQSQTLRWLMHALQKDEASGLNPDIVKALNLYERFLSSAKIKFRSTIISDLEHLNWNQMSLFKASVDSNGNKLAWHQPSLEQRMSLFSDAAEKLCRQAFSQEEDCPDYLFQVSCTGYESPNAIQKLALEKNWEDKVRCINVGHMGCYASIPTTQLATNLVQGLFQRSESKQARVSLFFMELCTLHLKPKNVEPHVLVTNALFADGAIRMDVGLEKVSPCFAMIDSHEQIIPETSDLMTWTLSNSGFSMFLARSIARNISDKVASFVKKFLARSGVSLDAISRFAIHPGGPLIIDSIAKALDLDSDSVRHSRKVLEENGNMSSCTLPRIWHEMLIDPQVSEGELVLSLAFGPGLTMTTNLLRKEGGV